MANLVDDFATAAAASIKRMGQLVLLNKANVYGIFEDDFQEVIFGDNTFESNQPLLTIATGDFGTTAEGDTCTIADVNYTVADIRKQTGGVTDIRLRETS